jgi:hypothetical protein
MTQPPFISIPLPPGCYSSPCGTKFHIDRLVITSSAKICLKCSCFTTKTSLTDLCNCLDRVKPSYNVSGKMQQIKLIKQENFLKGKSENDMTL